MNLWIRSQNKEKLCKIENIKYMDTSDDFENDTHSLWNDNNGILGIYKTKQRALEVLDEIQSFLENNYISIDEMPSHSNSPYPGYYPTHISTMYRKKVFKMPKE